MLLALYGYMLVKVILLKMQDWDPGYLWSRLLSGLLKPSLLFHWLETGNVVPFREITRSLHTLTDHAVLNLLGNVVLFMPLGILLGLIFNQRGRVGLKIAFCGFFLSFSLETAQLLFMIGQFDVDDLLLNSLGGLLGYAMYRSMIRYLWTQWAH